MRNRPYLTAGDQPRPYSETLNDRDPMRRLHADRRQRAMAEVLDLEGLALAATDPNERKRLQCEAEGLRAALDETP